MSELLKLHNQIASTSVRKPSNRITTLAGVDVINDATYAVNPPKKGQTRIIDPAYQAWADMLKRGDVCDDWKTFSNFLNWWKQNIIDGCELDADILSSMSLPHKLYSPTTCLYVSRKLNTFINSNIGHNKSGLMTGVTRDSRTGKYCAQCRNPNNHDGGRHVGTFNTEIEAHAAWLKRKLEYAEMFKLELDAKHPAAYQALVDMIHKM